MSLTVKYPTTTNGNPGDPAKILAQDLYTYVAGRGKKETVILLSGGSSLQCLTPLAALIKSGPPIDFSQCVFGVADERFAEESNTYRAITKIYKDLYYAVANCGATFIDTSPHLANLAEMADWYNTKLEYYFEKIQTSENGEILVLLGMGADGHIAGIMPYPEKKDWFTETFIENKRLVVGYDAGAKNTIPLRFTLTFRGLGYGVKYMAYVTGDQKAQVLQKALTQEVPLAELPAVYFQTIADRLTLYTDIPLQLD